MWHERAWHRPWQREMNPRAGSREQALRQALHLTGLSMPPPGRSARLAQLLLVRWSASTGRQLSWVMDATEEHWAGSVPLYLQPYDVVFIPNTPIDDVDIWIDNYIRRVIPFPYIIAPTSD